jgi:hypothetical protein
MLHGAVVPGLVLAVSANPISEQVGGRVLLLCQRIPTANGPDCLTFRDHGSTTALVTFDYAKKAGLEGVACNLELTVVGERSDTLATKIFIIPLLDKNGQRHEICAFGIDRITTDMRTLGVEQALRQFKHVAGGEVDPPPMVRSTCWWAWVMPIFFPCSNR